MLTRLMLLTCALSAGQTSDWQLQPHLARGQELAYSGSFSEEALNAGVQFQHTFKVDTTVLVLDASPQKFELAVLTAVTSKAAKAADQPAKTQTLPTSVRLEIVSMDRLGKLLAPPPRTLMPPIEGPPTIECGAFVEVPKGRVGLKAWWELNEEGRTPRTWRVDGTETVNSVVCIRLVAVQQSEDWDTPRADRSSWQRRDTAWISPQYGLTFRYERVFERRDAAHELPTHRSVLRSELESGGLTYAGKLLDERASEIKQARKFFLDADALIREPEQHKAQLEGILKKIKQYTDAEAPTPFRKAIVQVQKRVESALRGETTPEPQITIPAQAPRAAVGQRIPDFVCTDLLTRDTQRLQRVLGKPVVVMFFNPATENGVNMLRLGQSLAQRYPKGLTIMAMAVTDDAKLVQKQHKDMNLPFSILDGNGLLQLFSVEALPRIVVLDGQGIVRSSWTGWGQHIPAEVIDQAQKLVAR